MADRCPECGKVHIGTIVHVPAYCLECNAPGFHVHPIDRTRPANLIPVMGEDLFSEGLEWEREAAQRG